MYGNPIPSVCTLVCWCERVRFLRVCLFIVWRSFWHLWSCVSQPEHSVYLPLLHGVCTQDHRLWSTGECMRVWVCVWWGLLYCIFVESAEKSVIIIVTWYHCIHIDYYWLAASVWHSLPPDRAESKSWDSLSSWAKLEKHSRKIFYILFRTKKCVLGQQLVTATPKILCRSTVPCLKSTLSL